MKLDFTPMSKQCHKVWRAETWSSKGKTVSQAQTGLKRKNSSVANKLVDVAMENMYCKIIAFAVSFIICNSLFLFTQGT